MASPGCRVAVVGAGPLVGLPHARRIAALPNASLACICDLYPEEAAEELEVPAYKSAREMTEAEQLDGVVIATPTHFHLPALLDVLAGNKARGGGLKAVLVEKPIAESVASANAILAAAEEAGVTLLVGHQRRYSNTSQKAKEAVTAAEFGAIRGVTGEWALLKPDSYFPDGTNPRRAYIGEKGKGGPVLINLIHDVDLLRFITGREVTKVFAAASGTARENTVEDTVALTMVLDNGAVGNFFLSDSCPSPWNYEFTTGENKKYPPLPEGCNEDCYKFLGAKRALCFPTLRQFGYGMEEIVGAPIKRQTSIESTGSLSFPDEPGWDAQLNVSRSEVVSQDPLEVQIKHFVQVCAGAETPICTGKDGLAALAIIVAVCQSADSGQAVNLEEVLSSARL